MLAAATAFKKNSPKLLIAAVLNSRVRVFFVVEVVGENVTDKNYAQLQQPCCCTIVVSGALKKNEEVARRC
jgi:hypothetical protein